MHTQDSLSSSEAYSTVAVPPKLALSFLRQEHRLHSNAQVKRQIAGTCHRQFMVLTCIGMRAKELEDLTCKLFRNERSLVTTENICQAPQGAPEKFTLMDRSTTRTKSKPKSADTKAELVLSLLRQTGGATLRALMAATGWQAHSVRGFISGQLTKKMGLKVRSFKRDGQRV